MIYNISQSKNMPIAWKIDVKKHELKENELNDLNYQINKNNFEIKTNKEQNYNVFFKFDDMNIGVKISEDNINKLRDFFSEDNFIANEKGLILDKDAASYVAGWFSDIAYRQNVLAADINNDGELRGEEFKYTFSLFLEAADVVFNEKTKEEELVSSAIIGTYLPSGVALLDGESVDISKGLDIVLNDDKNVDGIITFGEYLGADGKNVIYKYISDCKSNECKTNDLINTLKVSVKNIDKLKEKELEELKKILAMLKLKNEGLESLSADEKKLLKDLTIELKVNEKKIDDLLKNKNLGDFLDFTKNFVKDLQNTKLIDIKV